MLDFSRFRVLTFDCYGTLIDWESGILSALCPILAGRGKAIPQAAVLELYGELEALAEQPPFRSYAEVLRSVVRLFGQRLGFTPEEDEIGSLAASLRHWEPFPDTAGALRRLQTRYLLAILSNVDDALFAFTAPKLGVAFNHVITAQQAQAYKPSPAIFRLAQERIGIAPEHWLHIGQSIYHDVLPAQSLGLATVWVNRPSLRAGGAVKAASATPDLEVSDLRTLANLASGTKAGISG
jgi:2-haloacid dehalogenase